jgi:drug/metabolite transporter (DMT)-like permease
MIAAGVAWGVYSLRGRGATDPIRHTATNFLIAAGPTFCIADYMNQLGHASRTGMWLAIASGALASGVGYAAWYAALPALSRARAGIVQLAVPALAALGGVALLGEHVSLRLVGAAALILGGVGMALATRAAAGDPPARAPHTATAGEARP